MTDVRQREYSQVVREAEEDVDGDACFVAINQIAEACGFTPKWDYAGQVVRDVKDRMLELRRLERAHVELQCRLEDQRGIWRQVGHALAMAGYRGQGGIDGVTWLREQLTMAQDAVDTLERVFVSRVQQEQARASRTSEIMRGIVGDADDEDEGHGEPRVHFSADDLEALAGLVDGDAEVQAERVEGTPWHQAIAQVVAWVDGGCPGLDRAQATAFGPFGMPRAFAEAVARLEPDGGTSLAQRDAAIRQALIDEPPLLQGVHYDAGAPVRMSLRHWTFTWLVRAFQESLEGVSNYMEVRAEDRETEPHAAYVVTVRRAHGQTPAEKAAVLQGALGALCDVAAREIVRDGVCSRCQGAAGSHADDCVLGRALALAAAQPSHSGSDTDP